MKNPLLFLRENLLSLLLFVAPIPFLILVWLYFSEMQNLRFAHARLDALEEKMVQQTKQKEKNALYLAKMKKSEPQFLEKTLENLSFSSLTSGENRLLFQEENPRRSELIEEADVKQKLPVLLNEEELKKVLGLIESTPIGTYLPDESAPDLLIKNFTLTKKMTDLEEELFEVSFGLIKREPLRN